MHTAINTSRIQGKNNILKAPYSDCLQKCEQVRKYVWMDLTNDGFSLRLDQTCFPIDPMVEPSANPDMMVKTSVWAILSNNFLSDSFT